MSLSENVIEGTLKADGTLELDQKPSLSPGRVTVTLQPAQAKTPGQRGLADLIDEIRKGQQARGFQGRSTRRLRRACEKARMITNAACSYSCRNPSQGLRQEAADALLPRHQHRHLCR